VKSPKGESAWHFIVKQSGPSVSAAVLRVDGDTGTLSGGYRNGKFVLSHFTGERPFYLEVTPLADGTLQLQLSSNHETQTLTALRPEVARAKGLAPPTPNPPAPPASRSVPPPTSAGRTEFPIGGHDVKGITPNVPSDSTSQNAVADSLTGMQSAVYPSAATSLPSLSDLFSFPGVPGMQAVPHIPAQPSSLPQPPSPEAEPEASSPPATEAASTQAGHKVFAPTGIGVLYGKQDLLDSMPPWQGGGNMIADVTFEKTIYQASPGRFEAGTGNIADAVGLGAALDYVDEVGRENIAAYEHELLNYGTAKLLTVPGLRLIGTAREKAGVLSFVLDDVRTEDVGVALNQEGIAVRAGHHCAQPILRRMGVESTVRPSLAFYNTCEDIDALVATLLHLQAGRGDRKR
jgi:hypothetical protein